MTNEKHGQNWDVAENNRVVESYFECLEKDLKHIAFVKSHVYRDLSSEIGRTEKSIERKFQNISAVLDELGCEWIRGLPPLRNFQQILSEAIDGQLRIWQPNWLGDPVAGFAEAQSEYASLSSVLAVEQAPVSANTPIDLPDHMRFLARKYDPVLRDLRNRQLGAAGEKRVYESEITRLDLAGYPNLASKVEWTSQTQGDGAGYDILSFDTDGRERLIEVKTTIGSSRTPFFMTRNELEFSRHEREKYVLLRLFDFRRDARAFELHDPIEAEAFVRPESFRISFE